jgi:hypothetical protein
MSRKQRKKGRKENSHVSPSPVHKAAYVTGNAAGVHEKNVKKDRRREAREQERAAQRGDLDV